MLKKTNAIFRKTFRKGDKGLNNKTHQAMVQEAVKGKFRGTQPLKSKVIPRYPDSSEREFGRIARSYNRLLYGILKEHLPRMMSEYKRERRDDSRFDDKQDLDRKIRQEFSAIAAELEQKAAKFGIEELVTKAASLTKNSSVREWKRVIKSTLGVDLLDDYYSGDFYNEALKKWIDENVLKIKSIPSETLGSMQDIIREGYLSGKTIRTITQEIQNEYDVSKNKATALARDQISTLNAQLTRMQQTDAGCTHYIWSDSRDSRVRDCHRELNGKKISWDDPPEMWYMSKTKGKVYTGRRCHPGEDYGCRCVPIPVFDFDGIDLPITVEVKK